MSDPAAEIAAMRAEVAALAAELAAMRFVVDLFYEAGRSDALGLAPRVRDRPRHLTVIRPR